MTIASSFVAGQLRIEQLVTRAEKAESALTAMTTRAEAAETEVAKLNERIYALAFSAENYMDAQEDVDPPRIRETRRRLSALIGHELSKDKVGPLKAADPPPEPALAGFAVGQPVRDKRDGETGIVLRIDATGVSWRNEKTDLVYISHGDDLEPAPQPAAAPKVLPVEEFVTRDELCAGLAKCDTFADLLNHLTRERGGEGKGATSAATARTPPTR